jgi:hypothetical protein
MNSGAALVLTGLALRFQRGGCPEEDGLVIEITLRMYLLARGVEITKVVDRIGGCLRESH